jgi:hypothetical protein
MTPATNRLQILHGDGLKVKPAVEIHGGDNVSESGNGTPMAVMCCCSRVRGASGVDGRRRSVHRDTYVTSKQNVKYLKKVRKINKNSPRARDASRGPLHSSRLVLGVGVHRCSVHVASKRII